MNRNKLWSLVAAPGLAGLGLLLAFLLLGRGTEGVAPAAKAAQPDALSGEAISLFQKSVAAPYALPGERRTVQLVLSFEENLAAARMTDTLPALVTWAGDLAITSGSAEYRDGALTWSGALAAGMPVTISYAVRVASSCAGPDVYTDPYMQVQSNAILNDGQGNVLTSTPAAVAIAWPFGTGSDRTFAIDLGDADNDGDLDLAIGNHGANQVCWNDGNGAFDCEDAFGGSATFDVEWGDMDRDEYLDLVVANSMANPNLVCRNNQDRTFTCVPFSYCSGPGAYEICHVGLGDVDNDGDLDIALGTRYPDDVLAPDLIYRNQGDGTFFDPEPTCQGHPTLDLAFGHLQGDDHLDLAVVGHHSEFICVNDGTGHFTQTHWLRWRLDKNTYSVAWGDADGDGETDVAVGRQSYSNEVYLRSGANLPFGAVQEQTWDAAWGDVDNDGDLDLATGNLSPPVVVYTNEPIAATPGPTLTRAMELGSSSHRVLSVDFGDVDADGDLDLAVGVDGGQNIVYLNTSVLHCHIHLPIIMKGS